ncbi:MAG: quinone-dependent dihydroorotate dehydrogenase [Magnetovibrio sp.]|nr:quinone-dependent dihydroorotate dehydrogenase [Magnetovibrio sp.]
MSDLYGWLRPLIFRLDPERAHGLSLRALKAGWAGRHDGGADPRLRQDIWGRRFANPVGMAAGFDKDAEVPLDVLALGFGFTEVGSVTPRPQAGNPKPRLFRLAEDRAVINRMGFNNAGMETVGRRLAALPEERAGPIGVNLGKNKDSDDAAADYVAGIAALGPYADYLVVNVSSPNTPGLRALQGREPLADLLRQALAARDALDRAAPPPLLLKVAPDLTGDDKRDIAEVALAEGVDGLIATNTTIDRPADLRSSAAGEAGGLSGAPLRDPAGKVLADLYRLTEGRLPIIGVGGIQSGADAYARIRAGASLVQLYTALVYAGPGLAARINSELSGLLEGDGFERVADAVGADHR